MGWQSGTMSGVCLAAMMPASRAAASTSPFSDLAAPQDARAWPATWRRSRAATATRSVRGFSPTSIICMAPPSMNGQWMPCSASQRSASMAAAQPDPAAVTACR